MRNVVRTLFFCLLAVLPAIGATLSAGESQAAGLRVILTPNADYAGFDLRTVKDVTLDACQAACIDDKECRAFTFNEKAGWCFLKSDFGALSRFAGATAGRVIDVAEMTPTLEKRRMAELDFLRGDLIDEARVLEGALTKRFDPADGSYRALRNAGGAAFRKRDYDAAAVDFGKALAIADDHPIAWIDFANASLARHPKDWSERQRAQSDATGAAISAYLRSDSAASRAKALYVLGVSLERRAIWKPAYRAYRASLALAENPDVRAAYERVIAEHGFRITSHEVDADSANPRICIVFSDDLPVSRPDLTDYVVVTGGDGLAVEPETRQICIDGVKHGGRYHIRVRGGLPSADGEKLAHPVELDVYVRDRSPWVGFAGNAYVLPAGKDASIPIVSVNTDTAKAQIYRIGERALAGAVRDGQFLRKLDSYVKETIADQIGEKVWDGEVAIASKLNETVTTGIPVAKVIPDMKPGAYVIVAEAPKANGRDWDAKATQWFVVSDLGLATLSGHDGLHVLVRSLSSAKAVGHVKLRLVATNNDILGEAVTDEAGYARFDPGLIRGTGGNAPQLIEASTGDGDYAFMDLTRAAFDLSDRGVEGRPAPGALDAFFTPERGIYRPGETIHLTALVRDAQAMAVDDLPITLVVDRPDGVEAERRTLADEGLGGYSADVALAGDAMRGSWRAKLYADPKAAPIAETTVLVEDFEPERLAFELSTDAKAIDPSAPPTIDLAARYLYGAPAPDLAVEGDVEVKPVTTLAAYPGYRFGLSEESSEPDRAPLDVDAITDADGKTSFKLTLPELPATTKLIAAKAIVRLADTNGRAVERTLSLPVMPAEARIGVKPQFEGDLAENQPAAFDVILTAPDGSRVAGTGLEWKLERLESDYQWYRTNGTWRYEVVTRTRRVGAGTIDVAADAPASVSAPVDYGHYRFTVQRLGDEPAATSVEFYAGWYAPVATSDTPDVLKVALDKPSYKIGDTAKLRLEPRFAGIALVMVIDDRLITMKTVEVPAEGTSVDLPVTDQWGPGAYVTAMLYRPMDVAAKRMPARALGLAWAKVAPGDRDLAVSLDLPDEMRPRQAMTIPVSIDNLKPGTEAYVTVAAVDLGILNLTNFKPPAPDDWYFGQRKLGMEIRDLYGLLIDRMQGVPGQVRSGGDSGAMRLQSPPPTQKLLAFYSGVVAVGEDGKATVSFDLPDFNGTVRVMAMAWSKAGIGHAVRDVFVRDPVVVTTSSPRFLAYGDTSRLLVEINNVSGAAGDYHLSITSDDGIGIDDADRERTLTLAEKQRLSLNVPITAKTIGDHAITVSLGTPAGETWPRELTLGVRPADSPVTRRNLVAVNGGGKLTIDAEPLGEFVPGTTSVTLSLGGAGRLDVAGILAALDRYPYGCAEQLTSRALPLLYLDEVAASVGIAADKSVHERVEKAIAGVLADQAGSGSFGLWGPYNTGDLWLDAYVTDFLTRAAEKGYDVPELARTIALDNLSNSIAYADDFSDGGQDIAYALYVLARTGRAAIGDLRYYAETKLNNFATPLAKAQLGAALSLYGDRGRAAKAFAAALADLDAASEKEKRWRSDYGSTLRDQAAVLTLAAETRTETVDLKTLATRIADEEEAKRYTSTQENAWMLMAAAALIKDAQRTSFSVNGAAVSGPLYKRFTGAALAASPVVVENLGEDSLDAVVATTGVPRVPEPAGGNGFTIERHYFTPEGKPADVATVAQNDRLVVVLTVTADQKRDGKLLVVDRIPAGFEIENPDISASGRTTGYGWLSAEANVAHTEAQTDRFVAALNRRANQPLEFSVAYSVRAVSPGTFAQPAATVEDMYRPELTARTATGTVEVVGPTR